MMNIKDEDVVENEANDDFGDIYDEANPNEEVQEDESAVKARSQFQKFIKKISSPS